MEFAASAISSTAIMNVNAASILSGYSNISGTASLISNAIRLQYTLSNINSTATVSSQADGIFALSQTINATSSTNCSLVKIMTISKTINAISQLNIQNVKLFNTVNAVLHTVSGLECYYYDGNIRDALSLIIPEIISGTNTFINLQDIQGNMLTKLYAKINDMFDQFFIETATHGLNYWEAFFGIAIGDNYTIPEEIEKLKNRILLNYQTIPTSQFDKIMDTYYQCNVTEDFGNSAVNITVLGIRGVPPKINDMIKDAEELLPCHLAYNFIYTYLTWAEIELSGLLWDEAETYTWDGLETAFL